MTNPRHGGTPSRP